MKLFLIILLILSVMQCHSGVVYFNRKSKAKRRLEQETADNDTDPDYVATNEGITFEIYETNGDPKNNFDNALAKHMGAKLTFEISD